MFLITHRKRISSPNGSIVATAAVFLLCALLSTAVRAEIRTIDDLSFTRVQLIGANELELTQDGNTVLQVRGDEELLRPDPFVVEGDTLVLGVTERGRVVKNLQFKLSAPTIEAVLVEGSGDAYVKPLEVGDLLVSVEGSGMIRMFDVRARSLEMRVQGSGEVLAAEVTADDAHISLKGSGDVYLGSLSAKSIRSHLAGSGDVSVEDGGKTRELEVKLMGSGDVMLKKLQSEVASVSVMGSGDVQLSVEEVLDVEIMGSGDVVYFGQPRLESKVFGSGDIMQRD